MAGLLPQRFFSRDALCVAQDLIGHEIWHGSVGLRITEVEAYRYPDDTACHSRMGKTARNAPMWGPPGHAYVYLCYGLHNLLNFVTNPSGEGAAVLVRACEPIAGLPVIRRRRGGKSGPVLLTGPGKVSEALRLSRDFSGHPVFVAGGLEVRRGRATPDLLTGPRIGIDYASEADRLAHYRFAAADSRWVSHRSALQSL